VDAQVVDLQQFRAGRQASANRLPAQARCELTAADVAHRRRMLAHLATMNRRAVGERIHSDDAEASAIGGV